MTTAADSLRRSGTKDGPGRLRPDAKSGYVVDVRHPRARRRPPSPSRWPPDGRKGERTNGRNGPTPARIVIDRQEKRYRECPAGERAIDRVSQTPLSYTEKRSREIRQRHETSPDDYRPEIRELLGATMTRAFHARANSPTGVREAERSVRREAPALRLRSDLATRIPPERSNRS